MQEVGSGRVKLSHGRQPKGQRGHEKQVKCLPVVAVTFGLLVACTASAHGQTLEGRLVPTDSVAGDGGATIFVLDSQQRIVGRASTDGAFRYRLILPRGGRYTLRVLTLGFAPEVMGPIDVAESGTTRFDATLTRRRVRLESMSVVANSRCKMDARVGSTWLNVWQQAREQLARVELVTDRADRQGTVVEFRGLEDVAIAAANRLTWEPRRLESLVARSAPFQDSFEEPPSTSELGGYGVDGEKLAAPAALPIPPSLLATDAFLSAHCFGLIDAPDDSVDWVGVTFRPVDEQENLPEAVQGVVWVARNSGEIRGLDYRRTGLRSIRYTVCEVFSNRCRGESTGEGAGGSLLFRRIGVDAWIVSRWEIRSTPVAVQRRNSTAKVKPVGSRLQACTSGRGCVPVQTLVPRQRVAVGAIGALEGPGIEAYRDSTTLAFHAAATEKAAGRSRSIVQGKVVNSLGQPLADAVVRAEVPETFARSDSTGTFRLEPLRSGRQTLSVERAGFQRRSFTVILARNSSAPITLVLEPLKD